MRFSEHFGLDKNQAELDFVDIEPQKDMPLFIDPFVISNQANDWAEECNHYITSFFKAILDSVQKGDDVRGLRLLSKLGEPNETCFGFSYGSPSGRGIGPKQARELLNSIKQSKAVKTGLISDIAELDLFVENVGPDKISDMATNILREPLIKYIQDQCRLHNIDLPSAYPSGNMWDADLQQWKQSYVHLPRLKIKIFCWYQRVWFAGP